MSVRGSPSPEVTQLASRRGFGRLEHTFLPSKEVNVQEKYRGLFIAASLTGIAGLATGGILLWVFVTWVLGMYPLLCSALAIGALLNSPNFRKKLGSQRLHLFERGLLVDMGAGQLFAVRWDHAVHYQETVQGVIIYKGTKTPFNTTHTSTLVARNGTRAVISSRFADFGTWLPLISEAVARAQAQKVWEAVREGQKVSHGPFSVDATGVSTEHEGVLPWSAVATIDVGGGFVAVRQHGQPTAWALAKAETVPNLLVFLTVASNLYG
ncbi:hypothetical protein QF026_000147 [Streptomyces aurantiacus]|uniref:DUF6585 family protein n=1 Tax=Streptomyces aurantiacus TaxID=47760 RepID=UPI002793A908|nr:DUF6585 family protein [Streptomyces aurantiacus]MDQ0771681.1 hypothetical protein [Streptomyces aurantiacus]